MRFCCLGVALCVLCVSNFRVPFQNVQHVGVAPVFSYSEECIVVHRRVCVVVVFEEHTECDVVRGCHCDAEIHERGVIDAAIVEEDAEHVVVVCLDDVSPKAGIVRGEINFRRLQEDFNEVHCMGINGGFQDKRAESPVETTVVDERDGGLGMLILDGVSNGRVHIGLETVTFVFQ